MTVFFALQDNEPVVTSPWRQDLHYEISQPPKVLRPYVRRFMTGEIGKGESFSAPARPTGYPYFGWIGKGSMRARANDRTWQLGPDALHISGQIFKEDVAIASDGPLLHVLVEFTPTGLYQLLSVEGDEAAGKVIEATGLVEKVKRIEKLEAKLTGAETADDVIRRLSKWLIKRAEDPRVVPGWLRESIELIETAAGRTRVSNIADQIGQSARNLNRAFTRYVGLSPQAFAKIVQMNHVAQALLLENGNRSLTELAQEAGFYDQSHFIRAMKAFFETSATDFLDSDDRLLLQFVARSRLVDDTRDGAS